MQLTRRCLVCEHVTPSRPTWRTAKSTLVHIYCRIPPSHQGRLVEYAVSARRGDL